jgi:hypothetical protein
MTPPAAQTQPDPLDPITLAVMIRATMDAIPHHPGASAEEQAALRHAAYTMIATLRPRDVLEAMLAARIAAMMFHIMDDLRVAADHDLPENLKLRHRASAASLTRVLRAAHRELSQRQALPAAQPMALPVSIPAPRPPPAPAIAPSVPTSRAAPVSRPDAAAGRGQAAAGQGQAPAARPATGGFVVPTEEEVARLVAGVEARLGAAAAGVAT